MCQRQIAIRASWLLKHCAMWALCLMATWAAASYESTAVPLLVQKHLQDARLAGQGQMRFLGFLIYEAHLWVGKGFVPQAYARSPLILELTYARSFSAQAIAERSIEEIERQKALEPMLAKRWAEALSDWLPDVTAGDRLTGLYLPGQGMQLWLGNRALGALNDAELARLFFGIWLSPQTSEPQLRQALLADLNSIPSHE